MFKLFHINKTERREVLPENGIYVVYELYEYTFTYTGHIVEKTIFLEDEALEYSLVRANPNNLELVTSSRIFADHFGYITLLVNNEEFNIEVRIQKLKVPELEDILLYVWNQDPIIFDNFFSKSSIKSKLESSNADFSFSSKFVNIFEDYHVFFKSKYYTFKSLSHYVLRSEEIIKDYSDAEITSKSIEWLLNNIDQLDFDYNYKNVGDSIKIDNQYSVVDKILTEERVNDYNIYENQIILGSFDFVLELIKKIKGIIKSNVPDIISYNKEYYSINEFRVIPFIKLKNDIEKVESKIRYLKLKYNEIFPNTTPKNAIPKLTSVFSNKKHYSEAYIKIKLMRDMKFSLDGELRLLNIKKISTLYERFNLYVLINSLLNKKPITFKKSNLCSNDIFHKYVLHYNSFSITLFYDFYIGNITNESGLQRISNGYYKPDYVIKVEHLSSSKIYILDSKYSSYSTVKGNHSLKCIKSYILDTAVSVNPTRKVEELVLLYPGENESILYGDNIFKPKISIMPSKVKTTNLSEFIDRLFFELLELV
ncbi:hypothetical protein [Sphingobacterium tabacisoli]|uniref:Restriction endonuclease n=1 Tax=Sphingobacterium tabacisoli TaxID=2044855 RepID=A0ABW5L8X1_9SPHI|nr:hypothetical protein [Sphingobacterium tabacisoli]